MLCHLLNFSKLTFQNILSGMLKKCQKVWIQIRTILCLSWTVFVLILYIPVNNSSVMLGQVFLSWTSSKERIKCLAQGHNTMPPVRLEPPTLRSWVQHSTTESLRSWSDLFANAISSRRQMSPLARKEWKVNSILKHLVILAENQLYLHTCTS